MKATAPWQRKRYDVGRRRHGRRPVPVHRCHSFAPPRCDETPTRPIDSLASNSISQIFFFCLVLLPIYYYCWWQLHFDLLEIHLRLPPPPSASFRLPPASPGFTRPLPASAGPQPSLCRGFAGALPGLSRASAGALPGLSRASAGALPGLSRGFAGVGGRWWRILAAVKCPTFEGRGKLSGWLIDAEKKVFDWRNPINDPVGPPAAMEMSTGSDWLKWPPGSTWIGHCVHMIVNFDWICIKRNFSFDLDIGLRLQ